MVAARASAAAVSLRASTLAVCFLIGACSQAPTRTPSAPISVSPPVAETSNAPVIVAPPAPQPSVPQPAEPPATLVSPWDRLRARLAMPGCDYNPAVQRWARLYTQGPTHFAATLKRAAPFLLMVLDELEKQDLPGEFAFLPYLESTYEPLTETRGNNAAGMWQFVASTARGAPQRLLLTPSARTRFLERYAQLSPEQWNAWSVVTLTAPQGVDELAAASGVEANLLGVVNGVELDRAFARGARVLLPAHARASALPLAPVEPALTETRALAHVVRNGDTLWDIARLYRVSVQQLQEWNGLHANSGGLHPGQRLRLTAPN